MAVTMADITKLRKMTGAGMMDCKNALTDAEGDFDKAMKIIREKGQAVAAKRSDREASEGCVLVKVEEGFGAIIALKCETDFVAQNADFVKLTQDILDAAVANKCKTLEEVLALPMGDATVAQAVTDRTGITGEKMELDGYMVLEGATIAAYNHMNRNGLCTMVAFNCDRIHSSNLHSYLLSQLFVNFLVESNHGAKTVSVHMVVSSNCSSGCNRQNRYHW